MKTLPVITIQLTTVPTIQAHGNSLRGYVGNRYNINELCNRTEDGKLRYRAPVIQYKILDGRALIVGLGEGVEALKQIALDLDELILEDVRHKVIERDIDYGIVEWGVCKEIQTYQFLTPWLPLNEKNYQKYLKASYGDKQILLKRILIGNLLSASKALGCNITEHISVKELHLVKVEGVFLKGVPFVGFRGSFMVNFHIPQYWGIGKSASRGFGSTRSENV